MSEIKEVIGGVITGKDIRLGEASYKDVTFKSCRMFFDGNIRGKVSFNSCAFIDCTWHFDGAAGNTLQFVNTLVQMMGPAGKDFLRHMFNTVL